MSSSRRNFVSLSDIAAHGRAPTLCVIAMIKNEHDKFASWIPYYLGEGADFIYVIDDRSDPPLEYAHPNVRIDHINGLLYAPGPKLYKTSSKQTNILEEGIEKVIFQRDCKWTMSVDVDEFVTTIRNERNTVKEELELHFQDYQVIDVPWVAMAYDRPVKHLLFDMVYRWDHDIPHHQKLQAFVSSEKFKRFTFTKPIFRSDRKCHLVESVHGAGGCEGPYYRVDGVTRSRHTRTILTLSEAMLQDAHLAIYHYRYAGVANLREKCQASTSLMKGYYFSSPQECIEQLSKLNSPDVFDPIMVRKWNYRHGTNITVSEDPPE